MIGTFLFFYDATTAALMIAFGIVGSGLAVFAAMPKVPR